MLPIIILILGKKFGGEGEEGWEGREGEGRKMV